MSLFCPSALWLVHPDGIGWWALRNSRRRRSQCITERSTDKINQGARWHYKRVVPCLPYTVWAEYSLSCLLSQRYNGWKGARNSHQHRYTLCLCEELRVYQGDRHQSPMARHYFLRYFRSHRKELLNIADLSRPLAHYISTRNNAYFILNKEYVWILRYHVLHVTCVPLLCFIRDTFLAT